jgi:DNA polymerase V
MKDPLETKKMIATTRMFGKPVYEVREIKEAVATYITRAAEKLRRQNCAANTISVFVVTNNYSNTYEYKPATSSVYTILPFATSLTNILIAHAVPLVESLFRKGCKYLKAGVILSGLVPDNAVQSNLFESPLHQNDKKLMKMIDNVNFSMRNDVLKFAASGTKRDWKMRQELRSKRFSTRWEEMYVVK